MKRRGQGHTICKWLNPECLMRTPLSKHKSTLLAQHKKKLDQKMSMAQVSGESN